LQNAKRPVIVGPKAALRHCETRSGEAIQTGTLAPFFILTFIFLRSFYMKAFILKFRKFLVFAVLAPVSALPLFAQDILPTKMNTLMDEIVAVFTSEFIKSVLIICLCGCAVAYGFNKDNEKMKRNIIAIAVAIAILVAASDIVKTVWNAAG
jgi:type IV secretory pathway VirB2 component (pilin)